jgi:hypothetical protein
MSPGSHQPSRLSIEEKVRLFRKRFAVREDVFLEKRPIEKYEINKDTGEKTKVMGHTFIPVCVNMGDVNVCLIAQRRGSCHSCTAKKYDTLSDAWVRQHIVGNRTLCFMPTTPEGAKMGAIDFDESAGDGLQAVFEDALRVRDYCQTLGIPSYIARSSNKGYHLYFWFSDWIPPHHFTSFAYHVLEKTGFASRLEFQGIKLPEVFPKQTLYDKEAVGNGIRAPLSEPDVKNGRNCFVNDMAEPYPLLEQWTKLKDMRETAPDIFEKILKEQGVQIYAAPVSRTGAKRQKVIKNEDGTETVVDDHSSGPISQHGSFSNVIAACPAMQEYWAKNAAGQYAWDVSNPKGLFNAARVASMNLALSTKDGEKYLKERWKGPHTERQIEGAKAKGYKPCTCRWMQQQSVCHINKHPRFGNHCFKKLAPVTTENGKLITNPDKLPEDAWPEPSPIRYSTEKHLKVDGICERFKLLVKAMNRMAKQEKGEAVPPELDDRGRPIIKEEFTPDNASQLLSNLMKRTVALKEAERNQVQDYVLSNKIFTKTEWNSRLKGAGLLVADEKKKDTKVQFKSFEIAGRTYFLKEGMIHAMHVDQKTQQSFERMFSNFWIERVDEPATIRLIEREGKEHVMYEDRLYKLMIHVNGQSKPITVTNRAFSSANAFFEALRAGGGTDLVFASSKDAYDVFMASISHFSEPMIEKHALKDIGFYKIKGATKYIMPSVIVTHEEIVANDAYVLEFTDDVTRGLDFQILDEDEFKKVARHITEDYFKCNNIMLTMSCFAHAMASVCTEAIAEVKGWRKAPVLWIAGDFSGGKTFVIENSQFFFGNFANVAQTGAGGSFKAKLGAADSYRHAFLGFDDHKDSMQADRGRDIVNFIQNAYDRRANVALKRDGTNRQHLPRVRGLIGVCGEDFPDKEASAVSRLILIDTTMSKNIEHGTKVLNMRQHYSGFTPYVVRHILQMPPEAVGALWDTLYEEIFKGSEKSEEGASATRVCENLTLNLFGFRIALDCMVANGAISQPEAVVLAGQHLTNLRIAKGHQLASVKDARASEVFMEDLQQLLADPRKYKIHGWAKTDVEEARNAETLGFISPKEPGVVFLYSSLVYKAVAQFARQKNTTLQSQRHIVRQLATDGFMKLDLVDRANDRLTVNKRGPGGTQVRVYPIVAEKLGYDEVSSKAAERGQHAPATIVKRNQLPDESFPLE